MWAVKAVKQNLHRFTQANKTSGIRVKTITWESFIKLLSPSTKKCYGKNKFTSHPSTRQRESRPANLRRFRSDDSSTVYSTASKRVFAHVL